MSIILVQKGVTEIRVIGYIEDSFKTLDWYAHELKQMPYNWGYDYLPHDGNTKDFKTGKSTAEILASFGRKTKQTPNVGVEAGIKMARMVFARTYFDKAKTGRLVECLKRYRRSISAVTNEPGAPVHDEYSHGADAWRYLGVVADQLKNDADEKRKPGSRPFRPTDSGIGLLG
jgi:phage terminase large subunit